MKKIFYPNLSNFMLLIARLLKINFNWKSGALLDYSSLPQEKADSIAWGCGPPDLINVKEPDTATFAFL